MVLWNSVTPTWFCIQSVLCFSVRVRVDVQYHCRYDVDDLHTDDYCCHLHFHHSSPDSFLQR